MTKAGDPLALESRVRSRLSRFAQPPPGDWPEVNRLQSRAARGRWAKIRPADLPIPAQVPLLWVPSAVVARLAQEFGFANAPHVVFRRWLFAPRVRQLAADRLGIRVDKPRSLARCPGCARWVAALQLEGHHWTCRHCAEEPCQGLLFRIAWLSTYYRLGIFDRNVRGLRRRPALRVRELAPKARTVHDLVLLAVATAVVGPWPTDWTGPRSARRRSRGPGPVQPRMVDRARGPVHHPPGRFHEALAPHWVRA